MTDPSAPTGPGSGLASAQGLDDRPGFDPAFLGVEVPMPRVAADVPTTVLPYTHFSVLFRPDRRFAAVTALGMDGARLFQIDREGVDWELDPRLAAELQAGPAVYSRNELDRGHLAPRAAACWGTSRAEAERADVDTFFYTNAAPQASTFDRGKQLWLGIEDHLREHAATSDRKFAVFAGPVLGAADPPYRGIQVSLRFWKVVAFVEDGELAATGYLLDQSPMVDDLDAALAEAAAAGAVPPLGAFRTFQVPIADIAALTGVTLDQLSAVDRLRTVPAAEAPPGPGRAAVGWAELTSLEDVRI